MTSIKGEVLINKVLKANIEISKGGVRYYEELPDKPQINGVELTKNKTAEELLLQIKMRKITNQEIEGMFKE